MFKHGDNSPIKLYKYLRHTKHFKNQLGFNWEPVYAGVWYALKWLLLCGVAYFWFSIYSKELPEQPSLINFGVELGKAAGASAILALIIGAGGDSCADRDMFGCIEYSGDYTEPWSFEAKLELFIQIFWASVIGLWFAFRGIKTQRAW